MKTGFCGDAVGNDGDPLLICNEWRESNAVGKQRVLAGWRHRRIAEIKSMGREVDDRFAVFENVETKQSLRGRKLSAGRLHDGQRFHFLRSQGDRIDDPELDVPALLDAADVRFLQGQ